MKVPNEAEPLIIPNVKPMETPFLETLHGPVGQSVKRIDANAKVRGRALYGADLIARGVDVFIAVVRSEEAHAEILRIKTSKALKAPGVLGVFTAKDVKGTNKNGLIFRDQPVLVTDKALYRGDAIAIVTGTSEAAAARGAQLVEITYRPLPVVATIADALKPSAPKLHPDGNIMGGKRIREGNAETALKECKIVIREVFRTQTVDHAFLDLESGTAIWDGSILTVNASGQWVHEERRLIALAVGLPIEAVRVVAPATGGAFGGREDLGIQMLLGVAALCHPNRIVGLRYRREESMRARHKRHAILIDYTIGATLEGRILAAKIKVYSEEGAYASTGPAVLRKAASHCTGPYLVPNIKCDVYGVYTNNNPKGAMRGFGSVQMAIAYEGMIDRLAHKVGVTRQAIRDLNLIRDGDPITTGQRVDNASARFCLKTALAHFRKKPLKPNRSLGSHERRGVGMSVICFGLGYGDDFPDASRARVVVGADEKIWVFTGACDYGQGAATVVAQIAAEELGVTMDDVVVVNADTANTPEAGSTSASRQTFFTGNAVRLAAGELRAELLDVAGAIHKVHPNELRLEGNYLVGFYNPKIKTPLLDIIREARRRGFKLEGNSLFKPRTVCEQFKTGRSPRAFVTYLFAAHVCQVVVDVETGQATVERHIACHDVGKAINPQSVDGQISGGVAQGIGMALMEKVVMRKGVMMTTNFRDYLIPTTRDLPLIETVIVESNDTEGPYGARGVGEPPVIASAPAVISAIGNAIGFMPTTTPCNPERIWKMIRAKANSVHEKSIQQTPRKERSK
jgi:CO/xanthine dehydrogenase Mo-binding subunit